MGSNPLLCVEARDAPVKGIPGHTEVPGYMGRWLSLFDEPVGVGDLAGGKDQTSAAEVHTRVSALGVGIVDAFTFDLEFHLRQGSHHSEDHGTHGGAGVDVPTTKVQDPKTYLLRPEDVCEAEHVRRRSAEPVEGHEDQSVALVKGLQRFTESCAASMDTTDAVIDVKVVTADVGGK